MTKLIKFDFISYEETKKLQFHNQNRVINRLHLDKIKKQHLEEGLGCMPPIIVNITTNDVIDGQHRTIAYQELIEEGKMSVDTKIQIQYVVMEEENELDTIVQVNKNQKGWTLENYIDSEIAGGNMNYIKLGEWCKTHILSNCDGKPKYRYGGAILLGKGCQQRLQDRAFLFDDEAAKKAETIHSEMIEILKVLEFPMKGCWIESMAIAWHGVRDLHDFKSWVRGLKKQKRELCKYPHESKGEWNGIFSKVHLELDKKTI